MKATLEGAAKHKANAKDRRNFTASTEINVSMATIS
jgi:hypothetical protein